MVYSIRSSFFRHFIPIQSNLICTQRTHTPVWNPLHFCFAVVWHNVLCTQRTLAAVWHSFLVPTFILCSSNHPMVPSIQSSFFRHFILIRSNLICTQRTHTPVWNLLHFGFALV
ncbi:hypothetical protein ACFX2A_013858 [Malus domestica]